MEATSFPFRMSVRCAVGNRIVFWGNLYYGQCNVCRSGQKQLCRDTRTPPYAADERDEKLCHVFRYHECSGL